MTERVKAGKISFAKVFWMGFLIIATINIVLVFAFGINQIVKEVLDVIWCLIWAKHLWLARTNSQRSQKQVYHPIWFYVGFGIAILPILWFILGFIKGFIPAFLSARRGY